LLLCYQRLCARSRPDFVLFCFGRGEEGVRCVRIGDVGCGMGESLGVRWGMYVCMGKRGFVSVFFGGASLISFGHFCLEGLLLGEDLVSCLHVVPRLETLQVPISLLPPSQGAPHLSHNLHQLSNHLLHTLQNQCARPPTSIANPHTAQPPLLLSQHPQHRRHNPRPTAPKRMP